MGPSPCHAPLSSPISTNLPGSHSAVILSKPCATPGNYLPPTHLGTTCHRHTFRLTCHRQQPAWPAPAWSPALARAFTNMTTDPSAYWSSTPSGRRPPHGCSLAPLEPWRASSAFSWLRCRAAPCQARRIIQQSSWVLQPHEHPGVDCPYLHGALTD